MRLALFDENQVAVRVLSFDDLDCRVDGLRRGLDMFVRLVEPPPVHAPCRRADVLSGKVRSVQAKVEPYVVAWTPASPKGPSTSEDRKCLVGVVRDPEAVRCLLLGWSAL